jgi:hypothetical protein
VSRLVRFVLAVFGVIASAGATSAPIQWSPSAGGNGHWYELVFPASTLGWTAARDSAAASSFGGSTGHLVTITSSDENDFVRDTFASSLTVQRFATSSDSPGDFVWLGASDSATEGTFEWVTGEAFSFEDFGPFEPSNGGSSSPDQDYVLARVLEDGRIGSGPTWQWDDHYLVPPEAARLGYIVEFENVDLAKIPEPATVVLLCLSLAATAGFKRRR